MAKRLPKGYQKAGTRRVIIPGRNYPKLSEIPDSARYDWSRTMTFYAGFPDWEKIVWLMGGGTGMFSILCCLSSQNYIVETLASHAGVFRGARISSLENSGATAGSYRRESTFFG